MKIIFSPVLWCQILRLSTALELFITYCLASLANSLTFVFWNNKDWNLFLLGILFPIPLLEQEKFFEIEIL